MITAYYQRMNSEILRYMPPDAKNVLEIGCGTGALASEFKRINPQTNYVGIDKSSDAVFLAKSVLDRVICGDVEQIDNQSTGLSENSVDCLVYGDVLAQMVSPWGMLLNHAKLLKEGGQVIACISNMQHWNVFARLLAGTWQYESENEGLLNYRNLRFFTIEGIGEMFSAAGLSVFHIHALESADDGLVHMQELLEPIAAKLNVDFQQLSMRMRTAQYLVRAVKPAFSRRMLIHTVILEPAACGRVRVVVPDRMSATIPGVRVVSKIESEELIEALPGEDKVFILQRAIVLRDSIPHLKHILRNGYLIISEFDDYLLEDPVMVTNNFLSFRAFHAVQTSTESLARELRAFNPQVAVFQNQIEYLPEKRDYDDKQAITLFFGALNRKNDWQVIIETLNHVLNLYGDQIEIKVVYDRQFYDALQTKNKQFFPFCPYEEYSKILRSCDIGLLPLEYTKFNSMKSDLKFIECAAQGVAVLAGQTVYGETVVDGKTGFIYRDTKEFSEKLHVLIQDKQVRHKIADAAYEYVKSERMLSQHYKQRHAWYQQMLERLPELTAQLRSRVPELFE